MSSFKMGGETYSLVVNRLVAKTIREETGVDIFDLGSDESKSVLCLGENIELACNVVHACCDPRPDAETFGTNFCGQAIQDGIEAFFEALINFFPPNRREVLRQSLQTMERLREIRERKLSEGQLTESMVEKLEEMLDELMDTKL